MKNVKILGTGVYLPEMVLSNDDLSKMVETNDEWIVSRTGISTRRISQGETAWQMGLAATRDAMADAGVGPENIQAIIGTTISADYYYPSLSCIISKEIGAKNPLTIDIACACSGFVYALDLARRYLMDEEIENVLIVSAEALSKQTDYTDRSTCILFGDAGAATIVTRGEGMFASRLKSESKGMERLFSHAHPVKNPWTGEEPKFDGLCELNTIPHVSMAGNEVYKFATRAMPEVVTEACEKAGIAPAELDVLIPHQANIRIINTAIKLLGIDPEKVVNNIDKYGNTSSASIPICLHEARKDGRIRKGQKVGMVGFGAGLTYGACVLEVC